MPKSHVYEAEDKRRACPEPADGHLQRQKGLATLFNSLGIAQVRSFSIFQSQLLSFQDYIPALLAMSQGHSSLC